MIARLRGLAIRHPARLAVLGAILMLVGGSWYQATVTPPYRFIDEQAHVGYVLAVQSGSLPEIDTPIDQASGGEELRQRLAVEPERRRDVWVANNPPLTYMVAAGPAALTRALGLPGGPLLGLRLVNVAAAGAAVALTYLLARDLSGGDQTVGMVAAALLAVVPHLGFVASLGFNDGMALLVSTGVLLALARVCGAGGSATGARQVQYLGLWCALAAATRPMSLAFAVAAGALGLAAVWWRRSAKVPWAAAWLALPSLLLAGWFYALSVVRYGDPTGSSTLFEKFAREPAGSLWSSLRLTPVWEAAYRTLFTRRLEMPLPSDPYGWYRIALWVGLAGVAVASVLVIRSAVANRGGVRGAVADLPGVAWLAMAVMALVPFVLVAQHRSGGGAPHPRYLMPAVPILMAAVALAAVRVGTRWTGLGLVVALGAVSARQTKLSAEWLADNPKDAPGSALTAAYGTDLVRASGLVVAAIGLIIVVVTTARAPQRQ